MASRSIAVLGAGNVGQAFAGSLAQKGYDVRLYNRWEPELEAVRAAGQIELWGAIQGTGRLGLVTTSIAEAIDGVDLILVAVVANGHAFIAEALAPHIQPHQVVVYEAASLGTALVCAETFRRAGKRALVAESASALYACRVTGPARVNVRAVKDTLGVSALPASETPRVLALLDEPFDGRYIPAENVLAVGLNKSAPLYHCVPSLLNLGAIEQGQQMPYFDFSTPAIGRVMEAMDAERQALGRALGLDVMSFARFLASAYGVPGSDLVRGIKEAYNRGRPTLTPSSRDSRYITEDVPFGLVPWSSLGQQLGVPTPTIDAFIEIACTVCQRDFRAEGPSVERLGLGTMTPAQMVAYVTGG